MNCFECESIDNIHMHHIVPKSLGGTKTIPLCNICHGKVHNAKVISAQHLSKLKMAEMKKNGIKYAKNAPYGKRWHGDQMIDNEEEIKIIEKMKVLRHEGNSMLGIAKILTAEGIKNRQGGNFSHMTVRKTLARFM